jgi:hypothetical protein
MNPWVSFLNLISKDKRIIAQVQSTDAITKRINIIPVGSVNQIRVESNGSDYADLSYVFVEGGVIIGEAPNIRSVTTELLF